MTKVNSFTELANGTYLSSFAEATTNAEKLKAKAALATDKKIKDIKGKFNICGVYAEPVQIKDKQSHELIDGIRVVIQDDKGDTYASATPTMVNIIADFCESLWYPTKDEPIPVEVVKGKSEKGEYFTLKLAL